MLLVGAGASAHPEFNPIVVNRYVKIDLVAADEARLAYTVMYGAAPAAAERKAADANADGRLDDAETRALGERVRAQVATGLSVRVDGQPAALTFEAPVVGLAGPEVGPSPFSVDLVARVRARGAGPHTITLDDATPLPQLGETDIRVEEGPSTTLLESHRGPLETQGTPTREARILFRGPKFSALEDRSVSIRWQGSAHAPVAAATGDGRSRRVGLLAATAAAVLIVAAWVLRRKRAA